MRQRRSKSLSRLNICIRKRRVLTYVGRWQVVTRDSAREYAKNGWASRLSQDSQHYPESRTSSGMRKWGTILELGSFSAVLHLYHRARISNESDPWDKQYGVPLNLNSDSWGTANNRDLNAAWVRCKSVWVVALSWRGGTEDPEFEGEKKLSGKEY